MPKSIEISPRRLNTPSALVMPHIPLYQYDTVMEAERERRGDLQLTTVLRHMLLIREFENMLNAIRSKGEYNDIACAYRGPAHLSAGQEAAAVGMALALAPEDHIYGSHRSHGDFLAKGLASIERLSDNELGEIMTRHDAGQLLALVETHLGGTGKALSENFLLCGFLAEILMRACGFNRGMGGSMHAFFPPFGAFPNNAIVGGSTAIATGAALYKRLLGEGISVSITGDGSTGCGITWEAMNFASMAQLDALWTDKAASGLPVLYVFNNNFYAMGGQTIGETMAWDRLSRIGAGINAQALHAETVDGTNPLAVADAVARKRSHIQSGAGPALLDIECYRYSGHSTSDANVYRSREELQAWQQHDPIERYAAKLESANVLTTLEFASMREHARNQISNVLSMVSQTDIAPSVDIKKYPIAIGDLMFNQKKYDLNSDSPVQETHIAICPRLRQGMKKSRVGLDKEGQALSSMRAITLRDALFESVLHHMLHDERLIIYGEECRDWGGAFGVYRGLSDLFPQHRLFNSPISEAAIVATAVGYAMEGGRALIELMYADFIGRAGDEIFNQMAKWQAMSGGGLSLPVVLRCSVGSKYGAQHSQDWSSLVAHIPGLKVLYPATPYDAKGLLASALSENNPVVFFESQRLYDKTETHQADGVPSSYYQIALGEPDVKLGGDDVTILSIGPCLYPCLETAAILKDDYGISCEVIDARCLVPFNYDTLVDSVEKTGRLLIVTEACERGSFAATLASNVTQFAYSSLQAAPQILGSPNWIVPGAEMEATYFPSCTDILDHILRVFFPAQATVANSTRWQDRRALAKRGL